MQGRKDIAGFIAGFAGDDRYIVDYLVEEVLQRQTDQVRTFLLRTCVLDRLTGPLCDAVTGEPGGKATLEALDRANLFLVPLDDSRHWYRYHHLFADMLQTHLRDERPDEVADLHRRASQWYDRERSAVAGGSPCAGRRGRRAGSGPGRAGHPGAAAEQAGGHHPRLARRHPRRGRPDAAGPRGRPHRGVDVRQRVRRRRGTPAGCGAVARAGRGDREGAWQSPAGMVVVDEAEFARLPGAIEMYRAALALVRGDLPATLRHAQLAIDRAADGGPRRPGRGVGPLGVGVLEPRRSRGRRSGVLRLCRRAATGRAHRRCPGLLDRTRPTSAAPRVAWVTHCAPIEHALQLAAREPGTVLRGTADMYVGMSQIACERGDLHAASRDLLDSQELGEHIGLPQNPYRWRVAMARVREARGDLAGAVTLLDEAQRVYMGDFSPNVRPVPALRARVLAAQGNVARALEWARERGLSVDDNLTYVRRIRAHHARRVLLAQYMAGGDPSSLDEASPACCSACCRRPKRAAGRAA